MNTNNINHSLLSNVVVDDGWAQTQLSQAAFQLLSVFGGDHDVNVPADSRHVPEVKLGATHQVVQFALEGRVQRCSAKYFVTEC